MAIFFFAFLFRVAVILHNEYPPSSDIGLHGSIINLILDQETLPVWNPYHMGGQLLPTPPGFHFFVSILILFSGIPLLYAQVLTAAFFSSFTVFPAYLVSKRIWGKNMAGILASFFAAISALSLEMISWGGYTNIVSLGLIVTIMYLFLRDIKRSNIFNLILGAILFGSLILTHTFSLFILFPVLILYFVFLLFGKAWKLKNIDFIKKFRFFLVSGLLGVLIISPWLLRVFSFYLGASSEGSFLGGVPDNRNLILANRTVDSTILGLFISLIPAFFLFKTFRKKYSDSISLLLVSWFVVPLTLTHAYVFGVFVDYSRFMYFIDFPGIIIISGGLFYLFNYSSNLRIKFPKVKSNQLKKMILVSVFTLIFIIFIIVTPWAILPNDAQERADFYTTIQQPEYTTIEWIRNKTPEKSTVLVADHLYGWWLSGISKRATLSAAGLEFLLYAQEMEVARDAQFLLDTDYYLKNGMVQIREDGPYLSRHNPLFSIETSSGEAIPVFYFKDNETLFEYETVTYKAVTTGITENKIITIPNKVNETGTLALSEMKVIETSITTDEKLNLTAMNITRENTFFTVKKILLLYQGIRSVDLSYEITAKNNTNLLTAKFRIYVPSFANLTRINTSSLSILRYYNPYTKVAGYITTKNASNTLKNVANFAEIQYKMSNENINEFNINFQIEIFDNTNWTKEDLSVFQYFIGSLREKRFDSQTFVWDYSEMIEKKYDVTHIICRDPRVYSKFSQDPLLQFVFNSGKVAVFQVRK